MLIHMYACILILKKNNQTTSVNKRDLKCKKISFIYNKNNQKHIADLC